MEVRLLLLADFANVDTAGKLNVIGAFNQLYAIDFPATHPLMYLVMRISAELGEYNRERVLSIILFDEDGNQKWQSPPIPFTIRIPQAGQTAEFNPVIGLQNTVFERAGRYEYRVFINDEHKAAIPLDVIQRNTPPPDQ